MSRPAGAHPLARVAVATLATGVAAGLLGVALTLLLHGVQHLLYGYSGTTFLIGVEHASRPRRVVALAVTGVVVGLAWWASRRVFAGVSVSVTGAVRRGRPRLPVLATLVDAIVQIVAVAGGASLGREGAPRQAGALAGSEITRRLGLDEQWQRVLLACGAGAGLAAVYDVPLGGAAFTLEVLLATAGRRVLLRALAPAVVSAGLAALAGRVLLGDGPTYRIPQVPFRTPVVGWALLLGVAAGLVGVAFARLTTVAREHAASGWCTAVAVPVAFTALGVLAVAYPQLPGNGKGPAGLAFDGTLGLGLAATLLALKPLATAACLSAGAIGGVLTPALATGALLGAVVARLVGHTGAAPVALAVAGAAAVLAVTQRAPVTAVLLTLEFVGAEDAPHRVLALVAPAVAAVVVAALTARGARHAGRVITARRRTATRTA